MAHRKRCFKGLVPQGKAKEILRKGFTDTPLHVLLWQIPKSFLRLERARAGRSVTRGALGSAWVVAAILLHAFEYMPFGHQ